LQNPQVVVLGASNKPHRFAYKAMLLLQEYGYHVIPVHPKLQTIDGVVVKHSLQQIHQVIDTLTVYLGPQRSTPLINAIINLNPSRVILHPGTESEELELALIHNDIPFVKDCTLLMLEHGRF